MADSNDSKDSNEQRVRRLRGKKGLMNPFPPFARISLIRESMQSMRSGRTNSSGMPLFSRKLRTVLARRPVTMIRAPSAFPSVVERLLFEQVGHRILRRMEIECICDGPFVRAAINQSAQMARHTKPSAMRAHSFRVRRTLCSGRARQTSDGSHATAPTGKHK